MKIKYLGHACFEVESLAGTVVIDPFKAGSVQGVKDINTTADLVLNSHFHFDHYGNECVTLTGKQTSYAVSKIDSFHDDKLGRIRGTNIIHVLEAEGKKIVHLGDLGHTLESDQLEKIYGCDVLMLPIGGFYTIDAQQASEVLAQVKPDICIPMHYRGENFGLDVLGGVNEFVADKENVSYAGNEINPDDYHNQIVVMKTE